jgi:type IV pilus assembly protein PilY1
MTYSHDSHTDQGGILRRNIKNVVDEINPNGTINSGISDSIIRFINEFNPKGWDPTAELYYEAIRYFKALGPTSSYRCGSGSSTDDSFPMYCNQSASRQWEDPLQNYCQGNYIIIVNDEYPSRDHDKLPGAAYGTGVTPDDSGINTYYWADLVGSLEGINSTSRTVGNVKNVVEDNTCNSKTINSLGNVKGICPSEPWAEGTFNIAGLAYYAHTQDLRSDLQESQTIKTYAIAYRASPGGYQIPPSPMNQLWLAAKYGGFDDKNDNGQFDSGTDVWDKDGDGNPDSFYSATSGYDFENAFSSILTDIQRRESSGSSASVLATTGEGEGAIYQAYFIPAKTVNSQELTWIGYIHGLFIDRWGNIREDTNGMIHLTMQMTISYRCHLILQLIKQRYINITI